MPTQAVAVMPMPEEPDDWLSVEAAAVLANMSVGTVYRKIREGKLLAYEQGPRTVLKRSDVVSYMQPRPIKPKPKKRKR